MDRQRQGEKEGRLKLKNRQPPSHPSRIPPQTAESGTDLFPPPTATTDCGKTTTELRGTRHGLTQDVVAERMGTTKSAISRLEAAGKHTPPLNTLQRYAHAVGCELKIKLVPQKRRLKQGRASARRSQR
jgi:DNA-binding XRE family transcriptional regulator